MATGIEMYDAVRKATKGLAANSEFILNQIEAGDLLKLTRSELISRNYSQTVVDEVLADIGKGKLDRLASTLGVRFNYGYDAPKLLGE